MMNRRRNEGSGGIEPVLIQARLNREKRHDFAGDFSINQTS